MLGTVLLKGKIRFACCVIFTLLLQSFFGTSYALQSSGMFPEYGNWCNPNFIADNQNISATDHLDNSCKLFSLCLSARSGSRSECENNFMVSLNQLKKTFSQQTFQIELIKGAVQSNIFYTRGSQAKDSTIDFAEVNEEEDDSHPSLKIPLRPNWCGPGYPEAGENPEVTDELDKLCRNHDQCYDTRGWGDSMCDERLVEDAEWLIGELNNTPQTASVKDQLRYGKFIRDIFKLSKYYSPSITKKRLLGAKELLEAGKKRLPKRQRGRLKVYVNEDDVPNIAAKDISSKLVLIPWISPKYVGWNLGFDEASASPGIDFRTDDYFATTIGIDLESRFGKRFAGLSYSFPHQGVHRQNNVVEIRDTDEVASGSDTLKGYLNFAGIGLKLAGNNRLDSFLSSAEIGGEITWGYGSGTAKKNVAFVGQGSSLSNRTFSGNVTPINTGETISFSTKFSNLDLSFDVLAAFPDKDFSLFEYFRLGGFHIDYRRPTDEAEDIADFFNCPSCGAGNRSMLYDTRFTSQGGFFEYRMSHDSLPDSQGEWGHKLDVDVKYALGVGDIEIENTDISLYNNDIYYWGLGLGVNLEVRRKLEGLRSFSISFGGRADRHIWDTSIDGPWNNLIQDTDLIYSLHLVGEYRF